MTDEDLEEELLIDAQHGNADALNKILASYPPTIEDLVRKLVESPCDREDLTQEILCRIWKNLPRFKGTLKLSTWITQISRKTILEWKENS